MRQGQGTKRKYDKVMLRHVAVATYDTEIFVPGSQTLQTARINTIYNSTTKKGCTMQCSN